MDQRRRMVRPGDAGKVAWIIVCFALQTGFAHAQYFGLFAGDFRTQAHDVQGKVFIADQNTLFIQDFHYDGQGPDAFFWGDTTEAPTPQGFIIPHDSGSESVLKECKGQNLILRLPAGKSMKDVKSLAVWCRRFSVNFGSVPLPTHDTPAPKSLGPLPNLAHGVRSEDVIIQDARTLLVTKLFYDGAGPDAFFLVGKGMQPNAAGTKIPDEDGRVEKLKGYLGKDVILHLPRHLTVFDIDWFSIYCILYRHNFGHVMIPERPNVPADMEDLMEAASTMIMSTKKHSRSGSIKEDYYGISLGQLKTNAHDVAGEVFAASEDTFYIRNFHYDGQGPDAYFWAGTSESPSPSGLIVLNEFGTTDVLEKYTGQNIAITLPDGKKVTDIKWLSVWCRRFNVDFGHVKIPDNFQPPTSVTIGPLSSLAHGVRSDDVVVKDARTILIRGLHYDGAGPDAFFLIGTGSEPHMDGTKVPDENGSLSKLHGYQGQDVELRLPDNLTVQNIDWLALYCIAFRQNFGHVTLTGRTHSVPADLRSLRAQTIQDIRYENCEEMFPGVMHVSWKLVGEDIYLQMAGKIAENEYLSFGRSGHEDRAAMVGSDVAVAFVDPDSGEGRVVDYFLSSKSQCAGLSGACPDLSFGGTNDVKILSWSRSDGVLKVDYRRPLRASTRDDDDMSIPVSVPVSVVAAIGPLNSRKEVAFHMQYYNKDPKKIHFGRYPPQNRCSPLNMPLPQNSESMGAWKPRYVAGANTFVAQIGPTGGEKGYNAITGAQSWGIAWWINGFLIPEITVRRGTNYTFLVEGGRDPSNSAAHHPLYITNNPEGGGSQYLDQLGTPNHTVYAGITVDKNQRVIPTGEGRYCEWKHLTVDQSESSSTFEEYKKTLRLECEEGPPGVITWMPDENTPDIVYYQCFIHRNLGWRIRVVDSDIQITSRVGQYLDNDEHNYSLKVSSASPLTFILVVALFFLS